MIFFYKFLKGNYFNITFIFCKYVTFFQIVCCHLWGVAILDRKFLSLFLVIGFILYSVLYVHCTSTSASNSLCHSYLGSATFLLFTLLSTSLFLKSLQLQTFSIKVGTIIFAYHHCIIVSRCIYTLFSMQTSPIFKV